MSRPRRPCGVCPVWGRGWCAHLAKMQSPTAPACDYGLREMEKQYFRNYFAKRRKQKRQRKEFK